MATAYDVASYLVALRNDDKKTGNYFALSNLKIQKIMYYAQGGHYQLHDTDLITDKEFEAWPYGPVIPQIYSRFSKFGQNDISIEEAQEFSLNEREIHSIRLVWDRMKRYDAYDLVKATHEEAPWLETYNSSTKIIPNEIIRRFFKGE